MTALPPPLDDDVALPVRVLASPRPPAPRLVMGPVGSVLCGAATGAVILAAAFGIARRVRG